MISVAIDGPAGAGKSTIAKQVAKKLEFIYVDTGALYRTLALCVLENHVDVNDVVAVAQMLKKVELELSIEDGNQKIKVFNREVSDFIRTSEVSMMASKIASLSEVREFLLGFQRESAKINNIVMDGRDIGTVVLPKADVKIFLTASCEERAKRRYEELKIKGVDTSYEEVLDQVKLRDNNDMNRKIAPLKKASDAVLVDTTDMSIEQVIDCIVNVVMERVVHENKNK